MDKKDVLTIPNCITSLRIVGTGLLLFTQAFSASFFWIYSFTGLTDVLDGLVARLTHSVSKFGAKLDSIADLLFYSVMMLKIFPVLLQVLPLSLWLCVIAVLLIRTGAYIVAAVKHKQFAATHSLLNKATGLCVFGIPYILRLSWAVPICWCICAVSAAASSQELVFQLRRKVVA